MYSVRTQQQQRDSVADIGQIIVNTWSRTSLPFNNAVAQINHVVGPSGNYSRGPERVALLTMNLGYGDLN